ncbi:hypothetical protein M3J09_010428 [Ascochyta lentis]
MTQPPEPFNEEYADLSRSLQYLEMRIAKREEKLETLMQELYSSKQPSRRKELEQRMKLEKEVVEMARREWEGALRVFHGRRSKWDEEVRRRLGVANQAMLGIEVEVQVKGSGGGAA